MLPPHGHVIGTDQFPQQRHLQNTRRSKFRPRFKSLPEPICTSPAYLACTHSASSTTTTHGWSVEGTPIKAATKWRFVIVFAGRKNSEAKKHNDESASALFSLHGRHRAILPDQAQPKQVQGLDRFHSTPLPLQIFPFASRGWC
jgi:hypothetical protein